jgi:hypothetical protein
MVSSSSDRADHYVLHLVAEHRHGFRANSAFQRRPDEIFVIPGKSGDKTTAKVETVPQWNWSKIFYHEMRRTNFYSASMRLGLIQ